MNAASPVTESPAPLFSPEFVRNPYPTYAQHREGPRLQPLPDRPGLWLVFSYALHRQRIRHFGFGGDAHTCLGATLARLESQTAVRALPPGSQDYHRPLDILTGVPRLDFAA